MSSAPPSQPLLALPPGLNPNTLDTLTEVAVLLTALRDAATNPASSNNASGPTSQPGATPKPATSNGTPGPSPQDSQQTQMIRDLPNQADALRHRFQRARTQIRQGLPDLSRSIADQDAEIRQLQDRIRRQRESVAHLRDLGARFAARANEDDGEAAQTKAEV